MLISNRNSMMISKFVNIDLKSSLFGFTIGIFSFLLFEKYRSKTTSQLVNEEINLLHWNDLVERRGIGELIRKVNHVAITVSDVGRSLSFYVDILGFQQIRRPTFDRHGAWLTMGNIELHLIKGIPCIPSVDNLQVAHIALETLNINQIVDKLQQLNIDVRQSLNVTNAQRSIPGTKSYITQYFCRDPDGYYFELCNCDVLTEFAFNRNATIDNIEYNEGIHNETVFEIVHVISHWKSRSRASSFREVDQIHRANEIDQQKFENLVQRRTVYGDLLQGFTDEQIKEALLESNNHIPMTIAILEQKSGDNQYFQPASFIQNGQIIQSQPFIMKHQRTSTF